MRYLKKEKLMENNLNIDQIKKIIEQLKVEIIEKENKIEELLKIINAELENDNENI